MFNILLAQASNLILYIKSVFKPVLLSSVELVFPLGVTCLARC